MDCGIGPRSGLFWELRIFLILLEAVNYRILGKTGLKVSEVGFGAWGIGDFGFWGKSDEAESLKTLRVAFDLGVNFYDTARVYGDNLNGRSEKIISKFVKAVGRENLVIASKVPPKNGHWPALADVSIDKVFPKDWICKNVEDSLKALEVGHLDLMQFHVWQDGFVENDEWKKTIQDLTQAGKVRYWGLSLNEYQPENCQKTIETGLISTVQLIFNIFHQKPLEIFPFYKKHNLGVIARVPLDEGGLSGTIKENTVFDKNDFRSEFFRGERLKELSKRVQALEKLLGREAKDLPELSLRYVLSFEEVSTVIPGMRNTKHAQANAETSDGRHLSPELLGELKSHVWERDFYH